MTVDGGRVRVVLVDDHVVVRSGLGAILRASADLELVGEAGDADEALRLCDELRPDVVLMDVRLPGMDGLDATRAVRRMLPDTRVVVLTSFVDQDLVRAAVAAGAVSYLLKNASAAALVTAVRAAASGQSVLAPEAARALVQAAREASGGAPVDVLTPRERDVIALLVDGLTNDEIAARLQVSRSTVKFHVASIFQKLEVTSRTEAVALALQRRLVR